MSQPYLIQHTNIVITVASWEERFLLGMKSLLEKSTPSKVLMFHTSEYSKWSLENRQKIADICKQNKIELNDKELLSSSPLESWKSLVNEVKNVVLQKQLITIDITTMTREVIWSICHELSQYEIPIQYVYHKPQSEKGYGEWLSRDPARPRILYKQAGIQHFGLPTVLIVQTGFDVDRVKQMERLFEPDRVVLGLQTGDQFGNSEQNRNKHLVTFLNRRDIESFDVDGYSIENVINKFSEKIDPLIGNYNIILSSLGPKVGALALYKIKQKYPDIAMCYAPSNEYNLDYSKGIGDCIFGVINGCV